MKFLKEFFFSFSFHVFKRRVTRVYWKQKEFPAVRKESTFQALRIFQNMVVIRIQCQMLFFSSWLIISGDTGTESEHCVGVL